MVDSPDSTVPLPPIPPGGRRRPAWVLAAGILAVGLVIGVGAVLVLRDEGTTLTSETDMSTPGAPAGGSRSGSGPGGEGSGSGPGQRTGSVAATPGPTATAPPTTAPTPTGPPKPEFTSAYASPDEFACDQGENVQMKIYWTTKNATGITLGHYAGPVSPNGSDNWFFRCGVDPDFVTIVAHGPGGDVSRKVSWRWTFRQP